MYVFLEQVPLYGTLVLSIISGFLYTEVSAVKPFLLKRKVKSLLIPFLIANFIVIILGV
jgi:fucose 4-O-acetylase-like acetyltransferase